MARFAWTIAAFSLALCTTPAAAQTATSNAYALNVNQTVAGPGVAAVGVTVGPLAATSGSAPPSYSSTDTLASVNQTAALTGGLTPLSERVQTGLLTSTSSGTATGSQATATVNNLSLGLSASTQAFLLNLLNINATTIQSSSQASSAGGLSASGSTVIEGLNLSGTALGALTFNGSLFSNPAPNTVLLDVGGLRIVLNEQILFGDGVTGTGITTNAIHVGFNNFVAGTGIANGDIIVGHSSAFASVGQAGAVPEPATWAMMLVGFGATGFALRRRKAQRLALIAA